MTLIPKLILQQLNDNGRRQRSVRGTALQIDFFPVIRLFTPDADAVWLITEQDPDQPEIFYGISDLGVGRPDTAPIPLGDLHRMRGRHGLPVERDHFWTPAAPLSAYVKAAIEAGRIVEPRLLHVTAH